MKNPLEELTNEVVVTSPRTEAYVRSLIPATVHVVVENEMDNAWMILPPDGKMHRYSTGGRPVCMGLPAYFLPIDYVPSFEVGGALWPYVCRECHRITAPVEKAHTCIETCASQCPAWNPRRDKLRALDHKIAQLIKARDGLKSMTDDDMREVEREIEIRKAKYEKENSK